jgi:hypothetical protein
MPRKLTEKQIDEDVWYETYDGNGTQFNDRYDFVKNAMLTLKGMTKYSKILRTIDLEPVGEMTPERADRYLADEKNLTYEIGNFTSTKGVLDKTKSGYIHMAQLDVYKNIDHTVAMELEPNDDTNMIKLEVQKILTEKLFLNKYSPHFLGVMGNTVIRKFDSVFADTDKVTVPKDVGMATVYERYTDALKSYMEGDDDFELPFFYYNVFIQAIIALAQFHNTTNMHLNGVKEDNLYYLYTQGFEGLDDQGVETYTWHEYQFKSDVVDIRFYVPVINLVVILHNFENCQTISEGDKGFKQVINDYRTLADIFLKYKPDKFLKQFMDKMLTALENNMVKGNIDTVKSISYNIIKKFGKFSGKDAVKGAVFYSKENYGSDVLNGINFLI